MPKIYVAFQTAGPSVGQRLATGSIETLKKKMRPVKASEWTVATYNMKHAVSTLCDIIEDLMSIDYEVLVLEKMIVNEAGQVRKVV